jgi:hypothetical protein
LAPWQVRFGIPQAAEHLLAGAYLRKPGEHQGEGPLDRAIRIFDHAPIRQADQSRWQVLAVARPLDLALAAGRQAHLEQMQFGLTQQAPQPQQQPVVGRARVVEAVAIGQQRPPQRGEVQQRIPIRVIARQAANLIGEHQPHMAQRHLRHQLTESGALAILPGEAQVPIDDVDPFGRPAQSRRALHQGVLVASLPQRRSFGLLGRALSGERRACWQAPQWADPARQSVGSPWLRTALVEASQAAARTKDPDLAAQ